MWPKVSTHHATNRIDPRCTHQMTSINNDPPFTAEKLMNQPINQLLQLLQLLDVTIPHPPSEPTGWTQWACDQLENPRNICRQMSSVTKPCTIATITKRRYALIPITLDHLGRLGYIAHEFLIMPGTQFPSTKPSWNKQTNPSKYGMLCLFDWLVWV